MSDVNVNAEPIEQRMHLLKTDGKTGQPTHIYVYRHRSKLKTKLWQLRHGLYGERISKKEALKFLPKD